MKITITCPIPEKGLEAGKTYDVPDVEAAQYIADEKAISAEPPKKKVKYDNG